MEIAHRSLGSWNKPEKGEPSCPENSHRILCQGDARLQHVCTLQLLKE